MQIELKLELRAIIIFLPSSGMKVFHELFRVIYYIVTLEMLIVLCSFESASVLTDRLMKRDKWFRTLQAIDGTTIKKTDNYAEIFFMMILSD